MLFLDWTFVFRYGVGIFVASYSRWFDLLWHRATRGGQKSAKKRDVIYGRPL